MKSKIQNLSKDKETNAVYFKLLCPLSNMFFFSFPLSCSKHWYLQYTAMRGKEERTVILRRLESLGNCKGMQHLLPNCLAHPREGSASVFNGNHNSPIMAHKRFRALERLLSKFTCWSYSYCGRTCSPDSFTELGFFGPYCSLRRVPGLYSSCFLTTNRGLFEKQYGLYCLSPTLHQVCSPFPKSKLNTLRIQQLFHRQLSCELYFSFPYLISDLFFYI